VACVGGEKDGRCGAGGRVMLTLFLLGLMWLAFVALTGKF
jgi:hypothetical protein